MPTSPLAKRLKMLHVQKLVLIPVLLFSFAIPVVSKQSKTTLVPDLESWKEFSPRDGRFTVLFPKKPKQTTGQITVGKLPVDTYSFSVQDDAVYSVLYFDVPHSPDNPQDAIDLLSGLRELVITEQKGKVLSESPVLLGNNTGKILTIGLPSGGVARAMIVVTARRLFRVLAIPPKGTVPNADELATKIGSKYIESFKLSETVNDFPEGEVDKYLREYQTSLPGSDETTTRPVSVGVLNGKSANLVAPSLSSDVRAKRISGTVQVRVVLDEDGQVIAAQADKGPDILRAASVTAVRKSRFSKTLIDGKPVKVVGTVQYRFEFDY